MLKNIQNVKFMNQLGELGLHPAEVIILGSATMALFGIRPNQDLDVIVSPGRMKSLIASGVFDGSGTKGDNTVWYYKDVEVADSFLTGGNGIENVPFEIVDGFRFQTLSAIVEWKKNLGRKKDLNDIRLIDRYVLFNQPV